MTVPADQATGLGPLAHAARRLSGQIVDRGHWGLLHQNMDSRPASAGGAFGSNAANAVNEGNNGISSRNDAGHGDGLTATDGVTRRRPGVPLLTRGD